MILKLIKVILLFISFFWLFSCNKNDDTPENPLTTIFKGKIANENGEAYTNSKLFIVRNHNTVLTRKADSLYTDDDGNYFLEFEDNEFSHYFLDQVHTPYPFIDSSGAFLPSDTVRFFSMNPTYSTSGKPIVEGINELNVSFCRGNSVEIIVNKISPDYRECRVYFGENESFSAWTLSIVFNKLVDVFFLQKNLFNT